MLLCRPNILEFEVTFSQCSEYFNSVPFPVCCYCWPWSLFPCSHKTCRCCYDKIATLRPLLSFFLDFFCISLSLTHLLTQSTETSCYIQYKGKGDQRKQFSAIGVTTFCKGCRNVTKLVWQSCRNVTIMPALLRFSCLLSVCGICKWEMERVVWSAITNGFKWVTKVRRWQGHESHLKESVSTLLFIFCTQCVT